LLKIAEKYAVNWPEVYYVGDSLVDMQVATSMGCIPLLVLTGNGRETYAHYDDRKKIQNFPDLAAAIKFILSTQK
jgi:D-glycero-D-manno-heptose 1,7-bisphosphate phosphatase